MDPGGPPSYAGGPAGYRGDASSSSSPPRPPPPPPPQQQQQGYAIQPVPLRQASPPWGLGAGASQSAVYGYHPSSSSPPPPPPQQQQQGHAIQPVWWLRQPSPPWGLGAGALPFGFGPTVPGPTPPLHPQFGSQQHPAYWWSTVDAGTATLNFEQNPGAIYYSLGPPTRPSEWAPSNLDAMGPHNWSGASDPFCPAVLPISNSDMVAVPQNWPQPPQFVQHPPWFGPQPLQPPPIHQDWRLVQIRSELLRSPTMLEQLVMSPEHSAILVHQLNVGDEEMRKMVLDAFAHCAHGIMEYRQGHAVFEALLGSLHGRYVELEIIVKAAVTPSLVSRSDDGVASLELLIMAVAGFPNLSQRLVHSFVNERVMDDVGGDQLIVRCFATMPTYVTTALINHAIATIDDKMLSPSGSTFLTTCFGFARGEAAQRFETTILARAVAMTKKRSGKRFVLRLLDHASIQFREQLVSKLMQNVLQLSVNCQGQFVLEHCFLNEENELLNIVLRACADLTAGDLQTLVRQHASRHFVLPLLHSLLERGNTEFPVTARRLALKIQALPLHIRQLDEFELLMPAVTRVLADNPANLGD